MQSLYSEHGSWLHRVRAGAKLASLALVTTTLMLVQAWPSLLAAALLAMLCLLSLRRAARASLPVLRPVAIGCLLVLGLHTLLGQPMLGITSGLRLWAMAVAGVMLTITTRPSDLLAVLEWLLRPLQPITTRMGLQTGQLALMLALMLRFTEHFFLLWQRMADAHRVRTGRGAHWRLLAPFAVQVLRSARQVADALKVRTGA